MSCPFAKYASVYPSPSISHSHSHHHHHAATLSTTISATNPTSLDSPLSLHLKQGTLAAHKAVERSKGVRAVLAMGSPSANNGWEMSRLDYVRWQLILLCVYA